MIGLKGQTKGKVLNGWEGRAVGLPQAPRGKITSIHNPVFRELLRLARRRYREQKGLFLIEGAAEVEMALRGGVEIERFLFCPPLFGEGGRRLLERVRETDPPWVELSKGLFRRASYRENPDGVMAVAHRYEKGLEEIPSRAPSLILMVEGVEKPGNLGAILRVADAVGVDGVVVCDPVVDLFNPNVIRASRGTLFTLKVATASTAEAITYLQRRGIEAVVTTPAGDTGYTEVDYNKGVAVVVGSEHKGVSRSLMDAATHRVRIPMRGKVDSLNVATATAVVLYEALRQRGR